MPQYRWTCLACSSINSLGVVQCAICSCPALVKVTEIEKHRADHMDANELQVIVVKAINPFVVSLQRWVAAMDHSCRKRLLCAAELAPGMGRDRPQSLQGGRRKER